jgi:hypothetical protein
MSCRRPDLRAEARRLRKAGEPFKRIAARLNVAVSTIHYWTSDIELTPEQAAYNLRGPRGPQNPEHIARRMATWRKTNQDLRLAYQEEGRRHARQFDPLHMAGCMLYWAEGAKQRNTVKFVNSDAAMVRFFVRFMKECLDVSPSEFRVRLNLYTNNGLTLHEVEDFWLSALELPRTCLRGHTLDAYPTSSSGTKRSLPYGTCTLTVARSTRLVQHIYGAIQEYAGFEEPRWLDGPPRKSQAGRRSKMPDTDELDEAA